MKLKLNISQIFIVIIAILASATFIWPWEFNQELFLAQRGGTYGKSGYGIFQAPCWTKPYLQATPEQLNSLASLHHSFYREISALRNQYLNLYYEIRARIDHPQPDVKMIFEKQKEFSEIKKKMDNLSIQYLLKAKALFTPEQVANLPWGCNLGFNYGQGMGWGRRMNPRYK